MAIKSTKDLELRFKAKDETGSTFDKIKKNIKDFANNAINSTKGHTDQLGSMKTAWSSLTTPIKAAGSHITSFFSNFTSSIGSAISGLYSVGAGVADLVISLGKLAYGGVSAFVNLNAEFEKMKVTLDVLTHGGGEAWFNRLNNWALNLPISMAEVTKSFTTMVAYGLTPSINMMQTLVDVSSVLPDSGRQLTGIAMALGQINSKHRLEGQELRQLAEHAIPGYEAVYSKIFPKIAKEMGKSVEDLKFTMIDSDTAIKAILEVTNEHFHGAAARIGKTWSGLSIRLVNYIKEAFREIGESGTFKPFRDGLENIVNYISDAFKSGEFQKIMKTISTDLINTFTGVFSVIKSLGEEFHKDFKSLMGSLFEGSKTKTWGDDFVNSLAAIVWAVTYLINTLSGIKLVLLIIEGAFQTFGLMINMVLYGAIALISKVINSIVWLLSKLPGMQTEVMKNALTSITEFTNGLVEEQGTNIMIIGQQMGKTGDAIAETAGNIANRENMATAAVKRLREEHEKLNKEVAKAPTTGGGGGGVAAPQLSEADEALRKFDLMMKSNKPHKAQTGAEDKKYWKDLANGIYEGADALDQFSMGLMMWEGDVEKNVIKRLLEQFKELANSLKSGFSSVIVDFVNGTKTFGQAITAMGNTIKQSFLKMFADMAATWLTNQVMLLASTIVTQAKMTLVTITGNVERAAAEEAANNSFMAGELIKFLEHENTEFGMSAATDGASVERVASYAFETEGKTALDAEKLLAHTVTEEVMTEETLFETIKRLTIQAWGVIKSVALEAWGAIKIIAIKAYQAAAEVFAALAGLGPWGIVLGIAGAAAAIALVMAFASKIGSFETGTGLEGVNKTGPAKLHKGEIVLNKKESDIFRGLANSGGGKGGGDVNLSFNIQSLDSENLDRIVRKKVIPLIRENIRDFGAGRTMVKEAMA